MKRYFKYLIKFIIAAASSYIIILAVLLSITRYILDNIEGSKIFIENFISKKIDHPLSFNDATISWSNLSPVLSIDHLVLKDPATNKVILKVRRLNIGINFFSTIWKHSVQPNRLEISGTNLLIRQQTDGSWNINSITLSNDGAKQHKEMPKLLKSLLQHGFVNLSGINAQIYLSDSSHYSLKGLNAAYKNDILHYHVRGMFLLDNMKQTTIHFNLKLIGNILNPRKSEILFGVNAQNIDLNEWKKYLQWKQVSCQSGYINNSIISGSWSLGKVRNVLISFNANNIKLTASNKSKPLLIQKIEGNGLWEVHKYGSGWLLKGKSEQLVINEKAWPNLNFLIENSESSSKNAKQLLSLKINLIDFQAFQSALESLVVLPDSLQKLLAALHISGAVKNLAILQEGKNFDIQHVTLSGELKDIYWQAWKKFPGIGNLNGNFVGRLNNSKLNLYGNDLELNFNKIFTQPLIIDKYSMQLSMRQNAAQWHIKANNIQMQSNGLIARADFGLKRTKKRHNLLVNLQAIFQGNDINQLRLFIPSKILHYSLNNWLLHAFDQGTINGSLDLNGPIQDFPFDKKTGDFKIVAHVKNVNLTYHQEWPTINKISADLLFHNRSLYIKANQGQILSININPAEAIIPDLQHPILDVSGSVKTNLVDGMKFIQSSPLRKTVGKDLAGMQLSGPSRLKLNLHIPLAKSKNAPDSIQVNGVISLHDNDSLFIPAWHLMLSRLQGELYFTEKKLEAKQIKTYLANQPIALDISTNNISPSRTETVIQTKGYMPIESLRKIYDFPLANTLAGGTDYHAKLVFQHQLQQRKMNFYVTSNLQGVSINLPVPFGKDINETVPFSLQLSTDDQKPQLLNLYINYRKFFSTALSFNRDSKQVKLYSGEIRLNDGKAQQQSLPGILIDGYLKLLDISQLKSILAEINKSLPAQARNQSDKHIMRKIELNIAQLKLFSFNFPNIWLRLTPQANSWLAEVKSNLVLGKILLPADYPHGLLRVDLNYLKLVSADKQSAKSFMPNDFPALTFICHQFIYGDKAIGNVYLQGQPYQNSYRIDNIIVSTQSSQIVARGKWWLEHNQLYSYLGGYLQTTDMGAFLRQWNLTNSLMNGQGKIIFNWFWPGSILQPQFAQLSGNLSLNLRKGRIINIGERAEHEVGIGRILNLLSLQTLPRRLTLDFSDLTHQGFSFDVMRAQILIKNGELLTHNAFLNGPVAKVVINGIIGLARQDYNIQLEVSPYVTSSLPLVATIAGGPLAGAITWVANSMLGKAVNRIAQVNYLVTGSWQNPKVEKIQ